MKTAGPHAFRTASGCGSILCGGTGRVAPRAHNSTTSGRFCPRKPDSPTIHGCAAGGRFLSMGHMMWVFRHVAIWSGGKAILGMKLGISRGDPSGTKLVSSGKRAKYLGFLRPARCVGNGGQKLRFVDESIRHCRAIGQGSRQLPICELFANKFVDPLGGNTSVCDGW